MNVKIDFNLTDANGGFSYGGDLGAFNLVELNPLAVALGLVQIESGNIQKLNFKATGNKSTASGSMNMIYT
ncbi:hypothetical protein, partial [Pseudomonas viridiflava]|uniref:hypothetical protein n=1 Tax=Pseudomonas viridiflava TaxID=33069 RepID=UPI00197F8F81